MNKVLVVVGPTAVGKTEYAIKLAQKYEGEIVSADSMQIYKGFDIGSAKPTAEELEAAKHHLVDIISPKTEFSVAEYQILAKKAIKDIMERNKLPIICGGTGLYVNSLLYDLDFATQEKRKDFRVELESKDVDCLHQLLREKDPAAAERIHKNNKKRVIRALEILEFQGELKEFERSFIKTKDYSPIIIGLTRDRNVLYDRIDKRVDVLIEKGLVDEVGSLIAQGLSRSDLSTQGIGYKEIYDYLKGEYDLDRAIYLVKRNSRHYAKRQLTWFKRYDDIRWFDLNGNPAIFNDISMYIDDKIIM